MKVDKKTGEVLEERVIPKEVIEELFAVPIHDKYHDSLGRYLPDPTPMEIPVGLRKPTTLADMVKKFIREEASMKAAEEGKETFEEADDFDVGDDPELKSPYELDDEQTGAVWNEERPAGDDSPPAAQAAAKPPKKVAVKARIEANEDVEVPKSKPEGEDA